MLTLIQILFIKIINEKNSAPNRKFKIIIRFKIILFLIKKNIILLKLDLWDKYQFVLLELELIFNFEIEFLSGFNKYFIEINFWIRK